MPPDHDTASISASSLPESTCDNEIEDICLLPEISIPINPKPLYFLNLVQRASLHRIWRWDNATLVLHARYTLSVMLATAAMLTFVLTFVPSQVLASGTKEPDKELWKQVWMLTTITAMPTRNVNNLSYSSYYWLIIVRCRTMIVSILLFARIFLMCINIFGCKHFTSM